MTDCGKPNTLSTVLGKRFAFPTFPPSQLRRDEFISSKLTRYGIRILRATPAGRNSGPVQNESQEYSEPLISGGRRGGNRTHNPRLRSSKRAHFPALPPFPIICPIANAYKGLRDGTRPAPCRSSLSRDPTNSPTVPTTSPTVLAHFFGSKQARNSHRRRESHPVAHP